MGLQSFKELHVWQKAFQLAVEVFKVTKMFPKSELYGLVSQMRRAAYAIPSNIAEGYARKHRAEYAQFVRIAFASGAELETQLLIAMELRLLKKSNFQRLEILHTEVMRMLNRLVQRLEEKE